MSVNLNPTSLTAFLDGLPIPWFAQNPVGNINAQVLGYALDYQLQLLLAAVQSRFPTLAPSDALGYLADERGMIKGPSESNASFALRLRRAWDYWSLAGTPLGLLLQLHYQGVDGYGDGYIDGYIAQENGLIWSLNNNALTDFDGPKYTWSGMLNCHNAGNDPNILSCNTQGDITTLPLDTLPYGTTLDFPSPSPDGYTTEPISFNLDTLDQKALSTFAQTAFASRFALIFPTPPASWDNITSNAPANGIGPRIGTTSIYTAPSTNTINKLNNIVNKWKPSKSTFIGTYVATTNEMIGFPVENISSRNSRNGGTIGGSVVVYYAP